MEFNLFPKNIQEGPDTPTEEDTGRDEGIVGGVDDVDLPASDDDTAFEFLEVT